MNARGIVAAAVALALGVGGYLAVGRPGVPSAPAPEKAIDPGLTPEAEIASKELLQNFGDVRAWLTLSDALIRSNRSDAAVTVLESAVKAIPNNPDLWVQMGIALVAHANGEVVPAARLAFDRAAMLAPDHPAPGYFLGLAWLQSGDVDRAIATWDALRQRSAPDAPWLPMLNARIAMAQQIQQAMAGGIPAPEGAVSAAPEAAEGPAENAPAATPAAGSAPGAAPARAAG